MKLFFFFLFSSQSITSYIKELAMKGKITCLFILTLVVLIICNFHNGVDGEMIKI